MMGDNLIAKIRRADIRMLENMKQDFEMADLNAD